MPADDCMLQTSVELLDGEWLLAHDGENVGKKDHWWTGPTPDAKPTRVPWIAQDAFPGCHGVFWYWREFTAPTHPHAGGRFLLRFWAVDYLAEVWVNGGCVGGHEGSETPFVLDVTDVIQPGKTNLVCVRVLNPSDDRIDGIILAETPHRNKSVSFNSGQGFDVGGIMESVEFIVSPALRVDDLHVIPDVKTGTISIKATILNAGPIETEADVQFSAAPAITGKTIASTSSTKVFPVGPTVIETQIQIENPRLWDLDNPYLYRVTAAVLSPGGSVDEHSVRCGFRDFRVENGYFRLNGKRLFLKSTHTGNHCPVSQLISPGGHKDLLLQDLLLAKTLGFNTVRFISGVAHPYQLDFCDEIGLMVYEESYAGWLLADSPDMPRRFDFSTREMIIRDRNHPCITIWGLLNETIDSPTYRHAKNSLPLVRALDDTRLVLLGSGRWDCEADVGSVANPGSSQWQHEWGVEAPDGERLHWDPSIGGYIQKAGDAHLYPKVPQSNYVNDLMRNLGSGTKPVFVSEYGIGSLLNSIRELRKCEEAGLNPDVEDVVFLREMSEKFLRDWTRLGFDDTYPFPEDMLLDSQRLMARWRTLGFDLIRSNPKICGFNLTGMLDHGITGEGVWTFWRELKPGIADAMSNGWAPLRWCMFVSPMHGYSGDEFHLEVVLANEDILQPGDYPVSFAVSGPGGVIWRHKATLTIPTPSPGEDGPLAVPALKTQVKLEGPAGQYQFTAYMEQGGAPCGGRLDFHMSDRQALPEAKYAATLWGIDKQTEGWLTSHGVKCRSIAEAPASGREVILVGDGTKCRGDLDGWVELAKRMARGAAVIFASPDSLRRQSGVKTGIIDTVGNINCSFRDFSVENVSAEEVPIFNSEFYGGDFSLVLTDIPDQNYRIELGMCEGYRTRPGERVFDIIINDKTVLEQFDIVKEAGGPQLAVKREFLVPPQAGKITIAFKTRENGTSISRLLVFDEHGDKIIHLDARKHKSSEMGWLPLENKGQCSAFDDWLYHKEAVAKLHPIFEGLQCKGIMDWDHYGEVVSNKMFGGQETPDDVAAAGFALGHCSPAGGYDCGIMVCSYPFGSGRFVLNTLRVLENVGKHPAADRLLINMLNYAAGLARDKTPLPGDFESRLKAIGYELER